MIEGSVDDGQPLGLAHPVFLIVGPVAAPNGLQDFLLGPDLGQNDRVLPPEGVQHLLLVIQHGIQGKFEFFHR